MVAKRVVLEQTPSASIIDDERFSYNTSPPIYVRRPLKAYSSHEIPLVSPSEFKITQPQSSSPAEIPNASSLEESAPLVHIRSNGKLDSGFPGTVANSGSSFDVESMSLSTYSPTQMASPFFQHAYRAREPTLPSTHAVGIRSNLLSDYNLFPGDSFEDFMEERLMRFRPGESQHNMETVLSGNHPFVFPEDPPRHNPRNWFKKREEEVDLTEQRDLSQSSNSILAINALTGDTPHATPFIQDDLAGLMDGSDNFITSCLCKLF